MANHLEKKSDVGISIIDLTPEQEKDLLVALDVIAHVMEFPEPEKDIATATSMFIKNQFGHLTIKQVNHAFELAAAGKFDGVNLRFYSRLNIRAVGEVLSRYEKYICNTELKDFIENGKDEEE